MVNVKGKVNDRNSIKFRKSTLINKAFKGLKSHYIFEHNMRQKTVVAEDHDEYRLTKSYFTKLKSLKMGLKMKETRKLKTIEKAKNHRLAKIYKHFKSEL